MSTTDPRWIIVVDVDYKSCRLVHGFRTMTKAVGILYGTPYETRSTLHSINLNTGLSSELFYSSSELSLEVLLEGLGFHFLTSLQQIYDSFPLKKLI